jgi:glycosyltransferase involved in cell wall biosynthesis
MNILFLIGTYPSYGGTEKVTTVLANHFCQKHRVHIVSFSQPVPELAGELNPNIKLHTLSYPVKSKSNLEILRDIIRRNKVDIIINQWCLPFYVTQLCNNARKGTSCKLISVLHGVPDKSKKVIIAEDAVKQTTNIGKKLINKTRLYLTQLVIKKSICYVYNKSDKYIVLSNRFIHTFQKYSRIRNTPKLMSISNAITLSIKGNKYCLDSKKKQILYVGRMDMENKRVNRIVEAWEDIFPKYTDWSLILVGDGPHRKQLEDYVDKKQINRVFFKGFIEEEPVEFYKNASILMLTSDLEGFGLVIVEGMSFGVIPVVYGSYASVHDIITHGESGYITNIPYSKEETVKYMRLLMDNDHLRKTMAKKAQLAANKFSIETISNQWEELFKEL